MNQRAIRRSCRPIALPARRGFVRSILIASCLFLAAIPSSQAVIAPTPDTGTWGVSNGLVNAIVRIGDVIYMGGDFQFLVSPDGGTVIPVNRLAAIDANTGQ